MLKLKKMRSLKLNTIPKLVSLVVATMLVFLNCQGNKTQETSQAQVIEDIQKKNSVILKIEDASYLNTNFDQYLRILIGSEMEILTPVSLSRLMDNFIEEKLLLYAANKMNISLTWEEKKEYLAKLRNESWSDESKETEDEREAENLFERLLIEKYTYELIKDFDADEEEIEEYYNLHKRDFLKPERIEVSQIKLDTEEKAINVLEKLKDASVERFREIARDESKGVEASRGGKMGIFEMGQLPFEMEKVVFALKEGELSQVVESSYGYHIFRNDKRHEAELVTLEKAAPSIKVKIVDQKIKQFMSRHIQELKERTVWSFYPENLSFPYRRNSS